MAITLQDFIESHRSEIDDMILIFLVETEEEIDDEERENWILNDIFGR